MTIIKEEKTYNYRSCMFVISVGIALVFLIEVYLGIYVYRIRSEIHQEYLREIRGEVWRNEIRDILNDPEFCKLNGCNKNNNDPTFSKDLDNLYYRNLMNKIEEFSKINQGKPFTNRKRRQVELSDVFLRELEFMHKFSISNVRFHCPIGPRGPPGFPGLPGRPGMHGSKGEKGNAGPAGLPGLPGAKGDRGYPGETILLGIKGIKGERGEKGDSGVPGREGVVGLPGMPGAKGEKGNAGPAGLPGLPGIRGERGYPGEPALLGIKGDKGDSGSKGERGERGDLGVPGKPGMVGFPGVPGAKGERGVQGLPGIVGPPGVAGHEGLPGQPGINGDKGEAGAHGLKGEHGIAGLPGPSGPRGTPGLQGPQGLPGPQGPPGKCVPCAKVDTGKMINEFGNEAYPGLPERISECLIIAVGEPTISPLSSETDLSAVVDSNPLTEADRKEFRKNNNGKFILNELDIFPDKNRIEGAKHLLDDYQASHIKLQTTVYYLNNHTAQVLNIPGITLKDSKNLYKSTETPLDFNVDENGLWIIFSDPNSSNTAVMKVDANSMEIQNILNVTVNHEEFEEMFIASGVLYGIKLKDENDARISFAIDLYTHKTHEIYLKLNKWNKSLLSANYDYKNKDLRVINKDGLYKYPIKCDKTEVESDIASPKPE